MSVVVHDPAGSVQSQGVVFVHSCPRAVVPHVQWALAKVMGSEFVVDWAPQPVDQHTVRSEIMWVGKRGTGARFASALFAFKNIRFEVTEDSDARHEGERFAATPALGLFRASIGEYGDVMVHEDRLRNVISQADLTVESITRELNRLLGQPWDAELEAFRSAHADSNVRVLHHVS